MFWALGLSQFGSHFSFSEKFPFSFIFRPQQTIKNFSCDTAVWLCSPARPLHCLFIRWQKNKVARFCGGFYSWALLLVVLLCNQTRKVFTQILQSGALLSKWSLWNTFFFFRLDVRALSCETSFYVKMQGASGRSNSRGPHSAG